MQAKAVTLRSMFCSSGQLSLQFCWSGYSGERESAKADFSHVQPSPDWHPKLATLLTWRVAHENFSACPCCHFPVLLTCLLPLVPFPACPCCCLLMTFSWLVLIVPFPTFPRCHRWVEEAQVWVACNNETEQEIIQLRDAMAVSLAEEELRR